MKSRTLISGDNSINIQADNVSLIFPDFLSEATKNPIKTLDESLVFISGLKKSSFLKEASQALESIYKIYNTPYLHKTPNHLLVSLTEELALTKMDLGDIRGTPYSAIPLFLKASNLWKNMGNVYNSLFDIHMLGVCSGIVGYNKRAISIFKICRKNIPKGKRFEKLYAHVTRDLGIAFNRDELYFESAVLLNTCQNITKNWNSEFNFGLDIQKLAIALAGQKKFDESYRLLDDSSLILSFKDDLSYVKNLNAKHFFAVKLGDKKLENDLYKEIIEICNLRLFSHQKRVLITQKNTGKTC